MGRIFGTPCTYVQLTCHTGVINSFLSWGFFKVLARLSYMFYLLHFGFMSAYFVSLNYTVELTDIIYVRTKKNSKKLEHARSCTNFSSL